MSYSEGKDESTTVEEPKGKVERNAATGQSRIIANPSPDQNVSECKICGKEVSGVSELEDHMKAHEVRRVLNPAQNL